MPQFTCDTHLKFLDHRQKDKLSLRFRSPHGKAMPHDLAISLGIKLPQAYAILVVLGSLDLCNVRLLIYHSCSEASVGSIPFGIGFPPLPWVCPECGETITDRDEMSFDIIAIAKEPIKFI